MILRLALVTTLALSSVPNPAGAAGRALTHTQFVEGYVTCNNTAWADKSRMLIISMKESTMSDKMRGMTSPSVRGFVGEALYFDGVYGNFQPNAPATIGWALATKAFADRGEVEPRFRTRLAALTYLRAANLDGLDTLGLRELGALATELELSARGKRFAITPIPPGTRLNDPLDAAAGRAMLAKVGTHFDVGTARTLPQPGRDCPAKVLKTLFAGAKR
jgi:hypothetical protein